MRIYSLVFYFSENEYRNSAVVVIRGIRRFLGRNHTYIIPVMGMIIPIITHFSPHSRSILPVLSPIP